MGICTKGTCLESMERYTCLQTNQGEDNCMFRRVRAQGKLFGVSLWRLLDTFRVLLGEN